MNGRSLEITTQIGCRVNCKKYCPQEIFTSRYAGDRTLSRGAFLEFIKEVPTSVEIIFSGLSEPFQNTDTPQMIRDAHKLGHPITVYSTLVGLSVEGTTLIKSIPFVRFVVHLPDPSGIADIQDTCEYRDVLNIVVRNVENLHFMSMRKSFVSDRSEDRVRCKMTEPLHTGRIMCIHHEQPDYFVLPNGNVYFCCQTRGQGPVVGNIIEMPYRHLLSKFDSLSYLMQTEPSSICHYCTHAYPHWMHFIKKTFGNKLIDIGKRYFL